MSREVLGASGYPAREVKQLDEKMADSISRPRYGVTIRQIQPVNHRQQ